MHRNIVYRILEVLGQGRPAVLAAVAAVEGSAPQTVGALMLAGPEGLLAGTVGGGALERRCIELAAGLAGSVRGRSEQFALWDRDPGDLGMACGGSVQVVFTPLRDRLPFLQALDRLERRAGGRLCIPLDGGQPTVEAGIGEAARPGVVEGPAGPRLELPLDEGGLICILGGGHVARELSVLLTQLEIRHVVADDRPEFSDRARFPGAEQVMTLPFQALERGFRGPYAPTGADGFCIMTRGHQGDLDCLRFALRTQAGYIGVMGSRRKRERLFKQLEEEGFSHARRRIRIPIGLDIGAVTPAEIAVSVAAQLVQWRAVRGE